MQQKSHYWSKYCFEEVSFKASVEGTEGRAVTESERKRIPDLCCREAKGTTTIPFSFEGGDARYSITRRRAQRPRRDIDLDKVSQVLRGNASDYFIAETFNSLFCGEPVQFLDKGFGMLCSTLKSY